MYRSLRLPSIAFFGERKTFGVLTKGFINAGVVHNNDIWVRTFPSSQNNSWFKQLGCQTTANCETVVKSGNLLVLTTYANETENVLREISPFLSPSHFVLSFCPSTKLSSLQENLPSKTKVARLVSNDSVQLCDGVSAYVLGDFCTENNRLLLDQLMRTVGYSIEVKEHILPVVMALTSGEKVYTFIDAMADGVVYGGIDRHEAIEMSSKIVAGAARMILETKQHPGILKDAVCSAGGTTIYGIHSLEKGGLRNAVINSLSVAT